MHPRQTTANKMIVLFVFKTISKRQNIRGIIQMKIYKTKVKHLCPICGNQSLQLRRTFDGYVRIYCCCCPMVWGMCHYDTVAHCLKSFNKLMKGKSIVTFGKWVHSTGGSH